MRLTDAQFNIAHIHDTGSSVDAWQWRSGNITRHGIDENYLNDDVSTSLLNSRSDVAVGVLYLDHVCCD